MPVADLTTPERERSISLRAILLGLVSVIVMCWLANYQLHVTRSSQLTISNFPLCALMVFVVWLVINSLLRTLAPKLALKPGELLTIMIMTWAAGMMPARGWSARLIGDLCAVQHFASPENRWEELLGRLLPPWLFPELMGSSARTQAGNWFATGVPEGQQIPWRAWAVPLFWWGTVALATLGAAFAITVIFHRQWVTYERLSFPLVTVPMTLVEVHPGERISTIFKQRLFWIGFAVVVVPLFWNLGGYLYHAWPKIHIYRNYWSIRRIVITGFPHIAFRIMPLVIGFLYLCNLDLLFSLWIFYLVGWLEAGIVDTLGFSAGKVGQKLNGLALVSTHNYGGMVFLVIWSIWVARRHLQAVWQAAVSRHRVEDNPGGVMSYRAALVLLALSGIFLVFFAMRMGMSLPVAISALLLIFVVFFVVAKYMAATGMAYFTPPTMANGQLLESLIGSSWMSPNSVVGLGLLHGGTFGGYQRVFGYTMMPHALKVGQESSRGGKRLIWALVLAVVVGAAFSIWYTLYLGYNHAALKMDETSLVNNPQTEINAIARRVDAVQKGEGLPPDVEKIGAWGVGFLATGVLTVLYGRFSWWKLHPVGLAFSASNAGTFYWFSIFLVWFAKVIILKFGGVRLYEKAKPFFVGLIVGYVFAMLVSYGVHEFFPGHFYQVAHDA